MQSLSNNPIGVFDSGFGGLTVLKQLQKKLPSENFIYLGDTARLPYGTKSRATIVRYTRESCSFLIDQGVKLIVIACNTATALAFDEIKTEFSIPIIGVIDPVIDHLDTSLRSIGVLATRATVLSEVYQTKIHRKLPHIDVRAVPAPLLVSLVEEGFIDHPMTTFALDEYLHSLMNVQCVILACTHFPLLKNQIEKKLGPSIQVIDPAEYTADEVKKSLGSPLHLEKLGWTRFFVTDDMDKFKRLGPQFLGQTILCETQLCQS